MTFVFNEYEVKMNSTGAMTRTKNEVIFDL